MKKNAKACIRGTLIMTTGLTLCLMAQPLRAEAAGSSVLATAGVSSILETTLSEEEYLARAQEAQGKYWGYTNLGIANVDSGNLNVRALPSLEGKLVGKMPKDSACEVLEEADGWAHITSGEVEGYVSLEYLLTGVEAWIKAEEIVRTVVTVNEDNLNIRVEPNTESEVLTQVLKGEELEYVETLEDGWVKVSIDGEEAYVSGEYVTVGDKLATAITMTELLYGEGVSDVRVELVEYAKQFLGNPYVYGGTSLTKGTDCSGFTMGVFKKFGVSLPHYSVSQSNMGTKISASDLKPGDLVFYSKGGTINHVAIYIGGGQVIHASSPTSGIKISKYNYRTPAKCVRILVD